MNSHDNVTAIILAAVKSDSMKGVNKMLIPFKNDPLILHTLSVFHNSPLIQSIILVVSKDLYKNAIEIFHHNKWYKITSICIGGKRRQDSVNNGLSKSNNPQELLRKGGTLLAESCNNCGGLQVKYKGRILCLAEDNISDQSKFNTTDDSVAITNLRETLIAKIQISTEQLSKEANVEKQLQLSSLLDQYVKLLWKTQDKKSK